jgi:hypothetical protein
VKTNVGRFALQCRHTHKRGEGVRVLLRQSHNSVEKARLKVEDVVFKREQFEVRAFGGWIVHVREQPEPGEILSVRAKVECLE